MRQGITSKNWIWKKERLVKQDEHCFWEAKFLCDRVYFWPIFYTTGCRVLKGFPHTPVTSLVKYPPGFYKRLFIKKQQIRIGVCCGQFATNEMITANFITRLWIPDWFVFLYFAHIFYLPFPLILVTIITWKAKQTVWRPTFTMNDVRMSFANSLLPQHQLIRVVTTANYSTVRWTHIKFK